jgi:hypothetical protein
LTGYSAYEAARVLSRLLDVDSVDVAIDESAVVLIARTRASLECCTAVARALGWAVTHANDGGVLRFAAMGGDDG